MEGWKRGKEKRKMGCQKERETKTKEEDGKRFKIKKNKDMRDRY